MQYYKHKDKIYKFIDHASHKNPTTREWDTVVIYTDGKVFYTREVSEFYERFSEVRYDSLEARSWELLNNLKTK